MWSLDPAESPELVRALDRHARGGALSGVRVGEGWRPLVEECHAEVEAAFPDYELLAVKQKHGVLAFQAFPRPWRAGGTAFTLAEAEALDAITNAVAERSAQVCERCGAPGLLRHERSTWLTLCDRCQAETPDPPDR